MHAQERCLLQNNLIDGSVLGRRSVINPLRSLLRRRGINPAQFASQDRIQIILNGPVLGLVNITISNAQRFQEGRRLRFHGFCRRQDAEA